jgi:hypothetical protein
MNGHRELCAHGWDQIEDWYFQGPSCMDKEDMMAVGVGRCLKCLYG